MCHGVRVRRGRGLPLHLRRRGGGPYMGIIETHAQICFLNTTLRVTPSCVRVGLTHLGFHAASWLSSTSSHNGGVYNDTVTHQASIACVVLTPLHLHQPKIREHPLKRARRLAYRVNGLHQPSLLFPRCSLNNMRADHLLNRSRLRLTSCVMLQSIDEGEGRTGKRTNRPRALHPHFPAWKG